MNTTSETKSAAQVIPQAIGHLRQANSETAIATPTVTPSGDSRNSSPARALRERPLRTPWQTRVLDLEANDELQSAADQIERWAVRFHQNRPTQRHFILAGKTGCGKTHCASNAYQWANRIRMSVWSEPGAKWPHPPLVEFVDWPKIVNREPDEYRRWLEGLQEVKLLFLDDIGAEIDKFKTGEPTERLREILNDFQSRFLFITTNIFPEAWVSRWDNRVADRLLRNSDIAILRETQSHARR